MKLVARLAVVGLSFALLSTLAVAEAPRTGPLDAYVSKPHPEFSWKVVHNNDAEAATTYIVRLTSQSWRAASEVDRTTWEHWLIIVKPAEVAFDKAFLMIGGGSNGGDPPQAADPMILKIAAATRSVVAELKMVPNQPLVFHDDGVGRKEDDLIGYAWDQYLKTGDATWLPRLPMVNSAVRAMDAIQQLMASKQGGELEIKKFVVAGGSKRGWTTWLTGAVDPRVAAIVPIVIDVLNANASMRHHAAVYGFWTEAIGNYVQHKITSRWEHPRMPELYQIVDPISYRDRLTMPKFVVNASGDQFFCPDSSQFYFADLKGEKLLRYVPNADHSLRDSDAVESITAFYQTILLDKPRPRYSWSFQPDGSIRVVTEDPAVAVNMWQATNPDARDFRLMTIGSAFQSTPLEPGPDGAYVARITPPDKGWTAFLVELTYDVGTGIPLKVSTAVRILPDVLPHADKDVNHVPYERAVVPGS